MHLVISVVLAASITYKQVMRIMAKEKVDLSPFNPPASLPALGMIYGEVGSVTDKLAKSIDLQAEDVISKLVKVFSNQVCSLHTLQHPSYLIHLLPVWCLDFYCGPAVCL